MKAESFYRLAQKEGACKEGLRWLKNWMKKNPDKSIRKFFEAQKKGDTIAKFCRLYWCINKCIDWKDLDYRVESKWFSEFFNRNIESNYDLTVADQCDVLIHFFPGR